MALSRHADEEGRGLPRANLLHAAALQWWAWGPQVGARPFHALQFRQEKRGRTEHLHAVTDPIGGLFQNQAQGAAAGGG